MSKKENTINYLDPSFESFEFSKTAIVKIKKVTNRGKSDRFEFVRIKKNWWTGAIDYTGWVDNWNLGRFVTEETVKIFCDIREGIPYWKPIVAVTLLDGKRYVEIYQRDEDADHRVMELKRKDQNPWLAITEWRL